MRHLLIHSLIHQPGEAEIHYGTRLGSDVHMFHVLRWTEQRDKIEKKKKKKRRKKRDMTNGNKEREKVSVVLEEEKPLETKSWIRSGANEWERREHND